ncbi:MAG TPA: hypothetical protein VFQ44_23240 [Streptosporangiaceae bacterium]|nr:hypothetical protein [Streptosporangiaceae bacterium]
MRRHWLVAILLSAGLALRILATIAYRPALLYVDTVKYLYNAYPGADPVGYKVPLKLLLAVGNLELVAVVQHLAGLAMAATIYVVLIRRGAWRWLAALATAPVLLDAYQVQIEQTIMPDVWLEALIVAGTALLLTRRLRLGFVIAGGFILGLSATVRQVGEILIIPALVYLVAAGGGWRTIFHRSIALTAGFAVPVIAYMTGSQAITGHFWLASGSISISTYGRMASAADCAKLRIPAYERALCPTARQRSFGIDWLDHSAHSPLKRYHPPGGLSKYAIVASFDHTVAEQQPARVAGAIMRDAAKLFAITRTSSQEGTPISRWQFQDFYPAYPSWVQVSGDGQIVLGLRLTPAGGPLVRHPLDAGYGGKAEADRPVAAFLRDYQLGGGYTPGPAMALLAFTGLLGSLLAFARRLGDQVRRPVLGSLLFFCCGVAVLAISDAFQFSWRYQLPALVTLPPAGALGIAALACWLGSRLTSGRSRAANLQPDSRAEVTAPAS